MAGERIGYIRVSSLDQNTVRQLEGVQLKKVFTDKASGKDTRRPQLKELLRFLRDGDTVVVHSMDRLARNLNNLRSMCRSCSWGFGLWSPVSPAGWTGRRGGHRRRTGAGLPQ